MSPKSFVPHVARLAALSLLLVAPARAQVPTALSTPSPSSQAQKTYNLLVQLENNVRNGVSKQTIMGEHCEEQKESYSGEYWVKVGNVAGRNPGFVEFDFGPGNYHSTYQETWVDTAVGFARDRFYYGDAICGFTFHQSYPGAPTKSWENCLRQSWETDSWFSSVVNWQSNTSQYQALLQDLSFAADKLQVLKDNGVPVLFRPFHEMNKAAAYSPFWWAARDAATYKQLWYIMHDYLVKTRGLNNLIFVWCPYEWDGTYGLDPWNYYPGANYVDVVAVDIYNGNPYFPSKYYDGLAGYNKPRMLAECDKLPVRWGDSVFPNSVSEIDARPWTIWSLWGNTLDYEVGTTNTNQWNASSNYKAARDTYNYNTGYWRVLTGGANRTYNWSSLH